MDTLLTKIRTAIYRATVVANARYRSDVLNLPSDGLDLFDVAFAGPFSCGDVFPAESIWGAKCSGTFSGTAASATRERGIRGDKQNHKFCRKHPGRHTGCGWRGHAILYSRHPCRQD